LNALRNTKRRAMLEAELVQVIRHEKTSFDLARELVAAG
jgi:hypothetical protein